MSSKLYYSISEVSKLIDEEQHILRYWEKEFDQLKPKKNRGGNRIYSDRDIEIIKVIKSLLREDKLSLKGAKEQIVNIVNSSGISNYKKDFETIHTQKHQIVENKDTLTPSDKVLIDAKDLKELINVLKDISKILKG